MTIWLLLHSHEGKTRLLNLDHIAEFQISMDAQKNYSLIAQSIDPQSRPITIASSPDESLVRGIITQLFQLSNRSGTEANIMVDIQDYYVQIIINL